MYGHHLSWELLGSECSTNPEWNFQISCTILVLCVFWTWISREFHINFGCLMIFLFFQASSFELWPLAIQVDQMTCREQHLEPSRSCEPTSVSVNRICWTYVKFIRYRLIKKDEDRVRFTVWPTWLFVSHMWFHLLSHVSIGITCITCQCWQFFRQVMASMMELYRNELLVQVKQQKCRTHNGTWKNHEISCKSHALWEIFVICDLCALVG